VQVLFDDDAVEGRAQLELVDGTGAGLRANGGQLLDGVALGDFGFLQCGACRKEVLFGGNLVLQSFFRGCR
jgi:hypothetical protein